MTIPISDDFKWSFSKLSLYETCPRAFWLQYLQKPPLPQQQNAFAEFGTLCHSLLEEYAKGELTADQLTDEYVKRYPNVVVHNFPPYPKGYDEKTFDQGLAYFESFDGFGDDFEVVSTEQKFTLKIGGYTFVGIADLVLKNKTTGTFITIDHKTKSESSMKKEIGTYRKQLYLYAENVFRKYGQYPSELEFNMIKSQQPIIEAFDPEIHRQTLEWAENLIDEINFEEDWNAKPNPYFCRNICGVLNYCEEGMECCK